MDNKTLNGINYNPYHQFSYASDPFNTHSSVGYDSDLGCLTIDGEAISLEEIAYA